MLSTWLWLLLTIISALQEPSSLTLADFLMENEGKRCVVVLDVSSCEIRLTNRWLDLRLSSLLSRKLRRQRTALFFLLSSCLGSSVSSDCHLNPLLNF